MAAGIAHEIRNPLVGIGSTAKLLLEDLDVSDARRPDLEIILNETRRLDRIVNQIVDYARPRVLVPLLFAMDDLIDETLTLLHDAIGHKGITVRRTVHPHRSEIEADRDQIKQVLLNLIQNAIEALEEHGTLNVAVFEFVRNEEPGIMVKITDNGIGIRPENLAHIFEPFFTSGKPRGSGLGLAICRNIVDAHRGDMTITSRPGEGTTVRLWLPLRQPRQAVEG
jgi:signal transduction histidine kinase